MNTNNLVCNPRYIIAAQVTKAVMYAALNDYKDGLFADGYMFQTITNDHDKSTALQQATATLANHLHETVSIWRRVGNPMSPLYAIVRPNVPLIAQERHAPSVQYFAELEEQRLERAITDLQYKLTMLAKL